MTDFEKQISDALWQPCGCVDKKPCLINDEQHPKRRLENCPTCLPKRIAASWNAVADCPLTWKKDEYDHEPGAALRALKGEP